MIDTSAQAHSSGRVIVSSVIDLDSDIYGAKIRHTQLDSGRFSANLQRINLANSVLDSGTFSHRVCGAGAMPDKAYTFVFVSCKKDGHLNNIPLSRSTRLYQPGAEIDGIMPADYPWFSFSIERPALHDRMEHMGLDQNLLRKTSNGAMISGVDFTKLEAKLAELYAQGNKLQTFGDARSIEEAVALEFIDAIDSSPDTAIITPRKYDILAYALDI